MTPEQIERIFYSKFPLPHQDSLTDEYLGGPREQVIERERWKHTGASLKGSIYQQINNNLIVELRVYELHNEHSGFK